MIFKWFLMSSRVLTVCVSVLTLSACASLNSRPASDVTEKSSADAESEARAYIVAGDSAYGNSDFDDALIQYMLALESKNDDPLLYAKVGTIYRKQRKFTLAERSFRRALGLDPSHIFSREGLALVYLSRENYKTAQTMFEGIVESDEKRWQSLNALGIIHDLQAQYTTAQGYYNKALQLVPGSAKLVNNLGYSYYLQGKLQRAEEQFKNVVEAYPQYSQGWSNLALVYMQLNEVDKAKLAFEKTVSQHQALNNIGYIELLNNKPEKARNTFKESIKHSPSFYPIAQQNLASLDSRTLTPPRSIEKKLDSIDSSGVGDESAKSARVAPENADNDVGVEGTDSVAASTSTVSRAKPARPDSVNSGAETHATRVISASRTPTQPLLERENILYVQEKLMSYGFNPGPIDGKLGRKTRQAIENYQRSNSIPVTGRISRQLLERL